MSTLYSKRVPASKIHHFLQAERNCPELQAFQQEFKFARHIDQIDIPVVLKRRISKHPKFSQLWSFSSKIPVPAYCKADLQIVSWFARGLARICFALGFTEDQTRELLWSWLIDQQPDGFDPDPEVQSQQIENLITFDWIQYGLNTTDQLRTKHAQKKTDKKEEVKQQRKATGKMKLSEKVLEHLAAHHGSTPTQIANALSKPIETMNVTLHRMVKKQQIGKTGYGSYCLTGERQPVLVPGEVVEVPEAVKQKRTLASRIPPRDRSARHSPRCEISVDAESGRVHRLLVGRLYAELSTRQQRSSILGLLWSRYRIHVPNKQVVACTHQRRFEAMD